MDQIQLQTSDEQLKVTPLQQSFQDQINKKNKRLEQKKSWYHSHKNLNDNEILKKNREYQRKRYELIKTTRPIFVNHLGNI